MAAWLSSPAATFADVEVRFSSTNFMRRATARLSSRWPCGARRIKSSSLSRTGNLMLLAPTENLQRRLLTADEAERLSLQSAHAIGVQLPNGKPFGRMNDRWEDMKRAILPGDEIWVVSSPRSEWDQFMGHERVELVRGGEVILQFVTARS